MYFCKFHSNEFWDKRPDGIALSRPSLIVVDGVLHDVHKVVDMALRTRKAKHNRLHKTASVDCEFCPQPTEPKPVPEPEIIDSPTLSEIAQQILEKLEDKPTTTMALAFRRSNGK